MSDRSPKVDALVASGAVCAACGKHIPLNREKARHLAAGRHMAITCSKECKNVAHGNALRERPRTAQSGFGKMEHNINAKSYCVEAPDRKRYVFRNLTHFVREHRHLFDPADVQTRRAGKEAEHCCALVGLRSLFRHKQQSETWKGWRGVWKKDRLGAIEWERKET